MACSVVNIIRKKELFVCEVFFCSSKQNLKKASAVLDVIDEEKLQQNCAVVGTYFLNELAKLRDEFEIVGDVRGKGLMIGVELVENKVKYKKIRLN